MWLFFPSGQFQLLCGVLAKWQILIVEKLEISDELSRRTDQLDKWVTLIKKYARSSTYLRVLSVSFAARHIILFKTPSIAPFFFFILQMKSNEHKSLPMFFSRYLFTCLHWTISILHQACPWKSFYYTIYQGDDKKEAYCLQVVVKCMYVTEPDKINTSIKCTCT